LFCNRSPNRFRIGDWGVTVRNASNALLDEVREIKGIESDYALAKLLGVRQQTVSSYRSGRTQMSDEIALRLALMIGKPAAPIFAELAAERAKHPDVAKIWKDAAKALAKTRGAR
jgi:predicted transcriptional regulator